MSNIFNFLANPSRFKIFAEKVYPFLLIIMLVFISIGLWYSLFNSPPDYQQGETVRIMYVHVPAAWMALMVYLSMTIMSIFSLVWRHPLADILSKSSAPIGATFTLIALVTGSIWGKPTWGTWWVWDARLTSVFILFLIYMGHIAVVRAFEDEYKGARAAAILTLFGAFNLPIIKFSVDWWNTLHQPASISLTEKSAIHSSMLTPLIIMTAAFALFSLLIFLMKYNTELIKVKNKGLNRL